MIEVKRTYRAYRGCKRGRKRDWACGTALHVTRRGSASSPVTVTCSHMATGTSCWIQSTRSCHAPPRGATQTASVHCARDRGDVVGGKHDRPESTGTLSDFIPGGNQCGLAANSRGGNPMSMFAFTLPWQWRARCAIACECNRWAWGYQP